MAKGVPFVKWNQTNLISQIREVCVVDGNGCWLWAYGAWANGNQSRWAYPEISINRKRRGVRHWVLFATTGLYGETARHTCDVPRCCNPDHLVWGSVQDNVADRVQRGRSATGDKSGFKLHPHLYSGDAHWSKKYPEKIRRDEQHPRYGKKIEALAGDNNPSRRHPERLARGERHGGSKLTEDQVRTIRSLYVNGVSIYRISKDFGINKSTASSIVRRRTWTHLQ